MREIIYRIWDEKVKRCVQDHDDFFIDPDGELHTIDIYEGADRFCGPGRYVIEQYTGLLDKNGKKIFEGDIISRYFNWEAKRMNGVVIYENGAYFVDFGGECKPFLMDVAVEEKSEIIGNVHVEVKE